MLAPVSYLPYTSVEPPLVPLWISVNAIKITVLPRMCETWVRLAKIGCSPALLTQLCEIFHRLGQFGW